MAKKKAAPHLIYVRDLQADDLKMLDALKALPGFKKSSNAYNILLAGHRLVALSKENEALKGRCRQLERSVQGHHDDKERFRQECGMVLTVTKEIGKILSETNRATEKKIKQANGAIDKKLSLIRKNNPDFLKRKY